MAQSKQQIQSLLSQAGSAPRHRFGQNFMIDQNLVRIVADSGQIQADDVVIEVGPGTGTLTEELLARAGRLIVVEIDRNLAQLLRARYGSTDKFSLIEGDALAGKHELNPQLRCAIDEAHRAGHAVKLVANLPYSIASPLIIELLLARVQVLAFTVQKEVADRLRGVAGNDAYGPLSVMVQLLSRVEMLRTLPPQAFWPAPKVESALVRLTREDRLGERARAFSVFVHHLFSARRKTLRRALLQAKYDAGVLESQGIDPQHRVEVLTPMQLLDLFRALPSRPAE